MTPKVAIVATHPIQHFCPWYAELVRSKSCELRVVFGSDAGHKPDYDQKLAREIAWADLDLSFDHVFLSRLEDGRPDGPVRDLKGEGVERALVEFDPDVVFIYGYGSQISRRAHAWARKAGVPLIYQSDSELRAPRGVAHRVLKRIWLPRYFKDVSAFLTVGDANESYLKHYGVSEAKMVRSGFPINTMVFSQAFEKRDLLRAQVRAKYDIRVGGKVVVVVGKLIGIKGHSVLLEAMRILGRRSAGFTLLIVGSGPLEAALRQQAASINEATVRFVGFVNTADLPAYYAAADVYVHPSLVEPHSLAITEASYMGLPLVVSSRCGSWGPTDDVRPGLNGMIYPCNDESALADAIERVVGDANLGSWFSLNSRRIAVSVQDNLAEAALRAALISAGAA